VKTDLFGKHASPDALLWFLGVYYGKKETCKANKQSLLQAIGLEEEGPCLNDRTWYLKSADRNYSENKVQAQYFEAPFLNAITPPTKAGQPQVVQYVPFFVIVVLRLTQMPWKLVVLVDKCRGWWYPWRRGWCTTRGPWKRVRNLMQMLQPVHLVVVHCVYRRGYYLM
jgi:hypothetical protein